MESNLRLKKQWEVRQKMWNYILLLKYLNLCNHRKQREKLSLPIRWIFNTFVLKFFSEHVGQLFFLAGCLDIEENHLNDQILWLFWEKKAEKRKRQHPQHDGPQPR